jgi:hypothetical protein
VILKLLRRARALCARRRTLKETTMLQDPAVRPRPADTMTPLILDLLRWLDAAPRSYAEVMEGWRTSCPRLTVWEDAVDLGYVAHRPTPGGALVEVTARGLGWLGEDRRAV